MTHPYLAREHPIRLAHRGSRVLWPENTMEAFQGVADLGFVYLEIDVQVTLDGTVVVFHDSQLGRVTNGLGPVGEWMWGDVQHLDAAWSFAPDQGHPMRGGGVGVPSLDELFATFPDMHINIDLKADAMEWAVADLIRRHRREDRTLISSWKSHCAVSSCFSGHGCNLCRFDSGIGSVAGLPRRGHDPGGGGSASGAVRASSTQARWQIHRCCPRHGRSRACMDGQRFCDYEPYA